MIEFRSVSVDLGRNRALRSVTCQFPDGVTALVGRNGAGKSTLIKTVAGVLRPTRGGVFVHGSDPFRSRESARAFLSSLGWMPQDPRLPGGARVLDVVRYAAWLRGVDRGAELVSAQRSLHAVDLAEMSGRRVKRLSGGQRRRVALACAMVGGPRVLLLDEPTVGLDPDQRRRLLTALRNGSDDRTVVLSTHLMEDVLAVADRVVVLAEGRVTSMTPVKPLLDAMGAHSPGSGLRTLTRLLEGQPGVEEPGTP